MLVPSRGRRSGASQDNVELVTRTALCPHRPQRHTHGHISTPRGTAHTNLRQRSRARGGQKGIQDKRSTRQKAQNAQPLDASDQPAGHASSWGPTSLRLFLVSSAIHPCTLETQKRRMVLRFIKICFQLHSTAAHPLCSRVSLAHLQQPRLVSPHPCRGSASSKGSRVPWLSRWRRKLSVLSTPLLTNRSSVRRSWPQSVVGEGWALLPLHRSGLTTCGTRPCRCGLMRGARVVFAVGLASLYRTWTAETVVLTF